MKINLIMPMGGAGSRFFKNGYMLPKPLIVLHGKPFFFWATESIRKYCELESLTFVILEQHIKQFELDKVILEYYPDASIVVLPVVLNGPTLTCQEGVKNIDNQMPILFNDCDHMFLSTSLNAYLSNSDSLNCDAGLLTFKSTEAQYSYIQYNDKSEIIGTVEKQVVSNDAICGAYLFKDKNTFLKACDSYMNNCNYSEYFLSGLYNEMCNNGCRVLNFTTDYHINFGTPEEYDQVVSDVALNDLFQ